MRSGWAIVLALLAVLLSAHAAWATPAASLENQPIERDGGSRQVTDSSASQPPASSAGGLDAMRIVAALAGVLVLIFVLRAAMRRFLPGAAGIRAGSAIKVLSRCSISPRQHFLLVRIGKRLVMVGDSGTQLNALCEIDDPDEVASLMHQVQEERANAALRFDHLFGRARKSFDEPAPTPQSSEETFDPSHEIPEPNLSAAREELSGLSEKVKNLARQFRNE